MRRDRHIWWDRASEDEVRALPQKANEHTAQEGSIPLPRSISDFVAHHQRVCLLNPVCTSCAPVVDVSLSGAGACFLKASDLLKIADHMRYLQHAKRTYLLVSMLHHWCYVRAVLTCAEEATADVDANCFPIAGKRLLGDEEWSHRAK